MSAELNTAPPAVPPAASLYTPEQVAQMLGLKLYTVRRLMREGRLKAVRHGGSEKQPRYQRISREAIDQYLASLAPVSAGGAR